MSVNILEFFDLESLKEDYNALFQYQKPKRVQNGAMWSCAEFAVRNTGQDISNIYHNPERIFDAALWSAIQYNWNPFIQYVWFSVLACLDFGGTMSYPTRNGEYMAIVTHPVTTKDDIEKLRLPDPQTAGDIPRQLQFAKLQIEAGLPVSFMSRSPFCMAANMCGITQFMTWLIEEPALCQQLMDLAYQHIVRTLDVWVSNFGAENIQVWWTVPLESNQLISPQYMEKFAMPYLVDYRKQLKKRGIKRFLIHFCGDQNKNLSILSEVDPWEHPAVLSFGPETDILDAAKLFPEDIIYGNLDTILMEKESPNVIFETSKELIKKGKQIEGGFILALGCDIPVFTPPANLFAMSKAIEDHGAY